MVAGASVIPDADPRQAQGGDGQTPLPPEASEGLKPSWVATRDDLNIAEEENIASATVWALRRLWTAADVTNAGNLQSLHRRMFGEVWTWAGQYRTHDTNIGIPWTQIPIALRDLQDDVIAQTSGRISAWPADEIAIRFHYRLVWIHPFPNGNGRHSRLAADLLAVALSRPRFTWGRSTLTSLTTARATYLSALREADEAHDFERLMAFARS